MGVVPLQLRSKSAAAARTRRRTGGALRRFKTLGMLDAPLDASRVDASSRGIPGAVLGACVRHRAQDREAEQYDTRDQDVGVGHAGGDESPSHATDDDQEPEEIDREGHTGSLLLKREWPSGMPAGIVGRDGKRRTAYDVRALLRNRSKRRIAGRSPGSARPRALVLPGRSEERRVGEEGRSRWAPDH